MKTHLKLKISLFALFFIVNTTLIAQESCAIAYQVQTVTFPSSGGSDSVTVNFSSGTNCSSSSIQVLSAPSWLTTSVSGTTINVSSNPVASYRSGYVSLLVNGTYNYGFSVKQGTPTCVVTGFPNSINMSTYGGTETYTLTYSNCDSSLFTFSSEYTSELTIPTWITVTQPTSNTIQLVATINDTGASRYFGLVGTTGTNTNSKNIYATIYQDSCPKWYPDTDGDGFGDYYGTPNDGCSPPPIDPSSNINHYVQNNDDYCPEEYSLVNNGCEAGYVHEDMNWILTKAYDINGTLKTSSKGYFNDLGKNIQNQALDVKTDRTWATQTMYDVQGRPALNTLSAPVRESGNFEYEPSFVENDNNNTYTSSDFESTPESPEIIGTNPNTLGRYYSPDNETDLNDLDPTRKKGNSYQDVTDYPFSRTIYSELNPGATLKTIGGNKQDGEWKQGYTFSMPAGNELTQAGAFNDPTYAVSDTRKIIKTVSRDVHGYEAVMFTDSDGKTLAAARVGASASRVTTITIREQGFVDLHVPIGTLGFIINPVSGITTEVYNLITELPTTAATSSLTEGFYRVSITNLDSYDPQTPITITCNENYYDYSLNYYDEAGRLTSSKQPLNHLESTFEYNALGQLTQTHSPDEGDAWFLYRKDGQIRFSINNKQWENKEFSYTNYDELGRPIESGVYNDASLEYIGIHILPENVTSATDPFIVTLKNIIDTPDGDGLNDTNCNEVNKTTYDYLETPDETFLSNVAGSYNNPSFLAGNVAKTHNDNTTTYYSYDIYGRVKWIVQKISGLGTTDAQNTKTIDYTYDQITSAVTEVDFQRNNIDEHFVHRYTYDPIDNSLVKVETSTTGLAGSFTTHANYKYYETGALKRVELAPLNNTGAPLQGIDYVYNLNGQLKSINHPSLTSGNDPGGDSNDLFGMQIDYHSNDYARTERTNISTETYGEDQFNGNIKGIRWNNKAFGNAEETFSYYYNKNNWLTDAVYGEYADTPGDGLKINIFDKDQYIAVNKDFIATNSITFSDGFHVKPDANTEVTAKIQTGALSSFQSGDYNVFDITYDANGNIRTLNRNKNDNAGNNTMDYLNYTYKDDKPNQLLRVDDAAGTIPDADDIEDQDGNNYEYNAIGQLIKNVAENIEYIYNASGLVTEIKKDNVSLVKFFYNDKGHRVKKENYTVTPMETEFYVRDAAGTALAIYKENTVKEHTIYGASRLGVFTRNTTGTGGNSVYQLTDHLGNVRAVVERSGSTAVALVNTDYYPFGMPMPNRNVEGNYRYKFQGQEKDPETGKEAFQLRLWDSRIGRWLTTDPYSQYHSPYLGMGNNPINGVDPDGGCFINGKPCGNSSVGTSTVGDAGHSWTMTESGWGRTDGYAVDLGTVFNTGVNTSSPTVVAPIMMNSVTNINTIQGNINHSGVLDLALNGMENLGGISNFNIYQATFTGDMYRINSTVKLDFAKLGKIGGNLKLGYDVGKDLYKAATNEGQKRDDAITGLATTGVISVATRYYPPIGVIYTGAQIISETETYKQAAHDARQENIRKRLENGEYGLTDMPKNLEFRQGQ